MSRRVLPAAGVVVFGGISYYLYTAGGNPKVAEKQFEHDASSASARLRGTMPGTKGQVQQHGESVAQEVGSRIDSTVDELRAKTHEADAKIVATMSEAEAKLSKLKADGTAKIDEARKETAKEVKESIDNFDKTVLRKTSEAKTGISSWFGFGK